MSDEISNEEMSDVVEQPTDKYARHAHRRANVKRRRGLYILVLFLALIVLALAAVDVFMLRENPPANHYIEYAVYGLIAVLFLWAFFMLFSRRRSEEQMTAEAAAEPQPVYQMENALLQCPECKSVFQYGQIRFHDHRKTAFSCPVCGTFSALPDPQAEPVKVLRPEGEFQEVRYHCNNCNEDLAIGTFGETPLHLVRFRACPNCGERGFIAFSGGVPPAGWTPEMEAERRRAEEEARNAAPAGSAPSGTRYG